MSLNAAIHYLYSIPQSIYQYRQTLSSRLPDPLYPYTVLGGDTVIEIPEVVDAISNVEADCEYQIISKREIRVRGTSFCLSFDVTVMKQTIKSKL
jgi:hypothetical protein